MPSLPPWISGAKEEEKGMAGGSTSKVKNAKKPKERPPRSLRDNLLFPVRTLPKYSGPYHVGTMEIEVPVREPRTFSGIKRNGQHLLQLKTVLLTVYYPSVPPTASSKHSRQLWLGRPRLSVAQGYSQFAKLGSLGVPMFLPTMFTKLPAWRNAPLSDRLPTGPEPDYEKSDDEKPDDAKSDDRKPNEAKLDDESKMNNEPPKFPLMVFSHGLGGTNTAYSSVCGEFASYGFVVVALEHRDGSGPRTFVNQPDQKEIKLDHGVDYKKDKTHNIRHSNHGIHSKYDVVDYIFPKDNPWDTAPHNEKGVDSELRGAQIDLRLAEIEEAYKVIGEINKGNGIDIATKNLRRRHYKGSSTHGLEGVDWTQWTGRIQMENAVAAGHSFGAATVTDMLRHEDRFKWVSQGIIYDIWGQGTRPPDSTEHVIRHPVLAINSEAFTYWERNFKLVHSLIEESSPAPSWLLTVRGTIHVNQSDFSILYPNVCSLVLKMTADPRRALDINVNASLEFLKMVMPGIPERMEAAFPNEGFLAKEEEPLSAIPTTEQHRPRNEQWTGGRLSIKHEFWWRIMPSMSRKMTRARVNAEGVQEHATEEVWVHKRPDEEMIERHSVSAMPKRLGCGDPCSKVKPQSVPCNKDHGKQRGHPHCLKGQGKT